MNVNNITFGGRVGKDPVMGTGSTPVANFSIASSFGPKDKEKTTWVDVACFNATAEFAQKYVRKGARVVVTGTLNVSEYEKDGQKRKSVQIRVNQIELGDWPDKQDPAASTPVSVDEIKNPFA